MDRNVYHAYTPLHLETEEKTTMATSLLLASLNNTTGLEAVWTKANIFHVSILSLLMLLTLLGNAVVIITIISCAELRKKRVNVFILNLAVGDLMVCFVSMPSHILVAVIGEWALGPVACKLTAYVYTVSVSSSIFLLTAMSIDRHQVRVIIYSVVRKPVLTGA